MTSADFAELVGVHTLHGFLVRLLIVFDWDLGGHSSHGVDAALVAGLDQELDVRFHEGHGHGHAATVREDELGIVAEFLYHAEDVVPASAIETGAVLAKLVDDLVQSQSDDAPGGKLHACMLSLTSSISKAAMMVSIRTVPRMVPLGTPMVSWARLNTSFQRRASRWLSILGR